MSKALLVMDMPTRCGTCVLRNSMAGDNAICHATMQDLTDKEYFEEKPNWCPLKQDNEQEIRTKAIEEFAERLKQQYQTNDINLCLLENEYFSYATSSIVFEDYIDEIAESMKGGK